MAMTLQKILANYLSARDARGTKDCEAKKGLVTLEKASHRCIPTTGLIAKEWQGTVRQDRWSSLQSCSWESLERSLLECLWNHSQNIAEGIVVHSSCLSVAICIHER